MNEGVIPWGKMGARVNLSSWQQPIATTQRQARSRLALATATLAALLTLTSACQPMAELPLDALTPLEQEIIGGTPSGAGDYPSTGVILAVGIMGQYGIGSMLCTGTLIAPDVVLTAGHCTENPFVGYTDEYEFYFSFTTDVAYFGQDTLDLPPQTRAVRAAIPHTDWDMDVLSSFTGGLANFKDIALMVLDGEFSGVTPAMLLEDDDGASLAPGTSVEIAGYGQRDADDPNSFGIKYHATTHINEVGSSEMQIGDSPPADPQKCHGDSGGPTFLNIDDGKDPSFRLIGVTSHAYDETDCHRGGVDTRVDTYLDWIKQTMVATCTSGLRSSCSEGGVLSVPTAPPDPDPAPEPDPGPDPDPTDPPNPAPGTDPTVPATANGEEPGGGAENINVGMGHACAGMTRASTGHALGLLLLALLLRRRERR